VTTPSRDGAGGTLLVSGLHLGWLQEEGREVALALLAFAASMGGGLDGQLERIEREAGVREQL
jgi:hypothetical protein